MILGLILIGLGGGSLVRLLYLKCKSLIALYRTKKTPEYREFLNELNGLY
jgi:hypothetical protein